jgi:hypothetical protein
MLLIHAVRYKYNDYLEQFHVYLCSKLELVHQE